MSNEIDFPEAPLEGDSYTSPIKQLWLKKEKSWKKTTALDGNKPSFITVWETVVPDQEITLPLVVEQEYGFIVDWGDGSPQEKITVWNEASHTYADAGEYTIGISGTMPQWDFTGNDSASMLRKVLRLGDVGWNSFEGAFKGCTALEYFDVGLTNTLEVTSTKGMLQNTPNLQELIITESFTTESVLDMSYMFDNCGAPEINTLEFDTSNVILMDRMFSYTKLNSIDITHFNTSNVISMIGMFMESDAEEVILTGLNLSGVQSMAEMFHNASNLKSIDLNSVSSLFSITDLTWFGKGTQNLISCTLLNQNMPALTTMSGMFMDSGIQGFTFNFYTSVLTDLSDMFESASLTNVSFGTFDFSTVTDMSRMFYLASKLGEINLSGHDLSSVETLSEFASGTTQLKTLDISNVDLASVTTMASFADGAKILNNFNVAGISTPVLTDMSRFVASAQYLPILDFSQFDTGLVTDMRYMMYNATKIIPSGMESMDVTGLLFAENMMANANSMPYETYDLILDAWESQVVNTDVSIHFGDAQYTAHTSKNSLTDVENWTIIDGGGVPDHDFITSWDVVSGEIAQFRIEDSVVGLSGDTITNDFIIDWGDGSTTEIISDGSLKLPEHTYTSTGTFIVRFHGAFTNALIYLGTATCTDVLNLGSGWVTFPDFNNDLVTFTVGTSVSPEALTLSRLCAYTNLTTIDIKGLEVSDEAYEDCSYMFSNGYAANKLRIIKNIDTFNPVGIKNADSMFARCGVAEVDFPAILDLSHMDFSQVETMRETFMYTFYSEMLFPDLSNATKWTDAFRAFYGVNHNYTTHVDIDLSTANMDSVLNMSAMFTASTVNSLTFPANRTNWSVNLTSIMFQGLDILTDLYLDNTNFSNVTDANNMFNYINWLIDPSPNLYMTNCDFSSCTNMYQMFYNYGFDKIDVRNNDWSVLENSGYMFYGTRATEILMSGIITGSITDANRMFYNVNLTTPLDLSVIDFTTIEDVTYFLADSTLTIVDDMSLWNMLDVIDTSGMFFGSIISNFKMPDFSNSVVWENATAMFMNTDYSTLDLSGMYAESLTNTTSMFNNWSGTSIDFTGFNADIENMTGMFRSTTGLTSVNLSTFLFTTTTSLRFTFDTSSIENVVKNVATNFPLLADAVQCFEGSSIQNSDFFSNITLGSLCNIQYLYDNCADMTESNFLQNSDLTNATNLQGILRGCHSLITVDLSNLSFLNVTGSSAQSMVSNCDSLLSIDCTNLNMPNITSIGYMGYDSLLLQTITFTGMITGVLSSPPNFSECPVLTSANPDVLGYTGLHGGTSYYVGNNCILWSVSQYDSFLAKVAADSTSLNPYSRIYCTGVKFSDQVAHDAVTALNYIIHDAGHV